MARIVGNIMAADTGGIGVNSVVTKSVEGQGITVAGVPAKKLVMLIRKIIFNNKCQVRMYGIRKAI